MASSSQPNPFVVPAQESFIASSSPEERVLFVRQTYTHVAGAWLVFFLIECAILPLPITHRLTEWVLTIPYGWLGVLGAFMGVAWMARILVDGGLSRPMQYAGLALYVAAEAVVFAPLLVVALAMAGPALLLNAVLLSGTLFAGLTATVLITRKDFSFLGSALTVAGIVSLGLIIASIAFGFSLGLIFSAGMIVVAGGAILYDTSRILREHKPGEHVAAALELFASMALLLWYVIRLLLAFGRSDD